MLPCISHRVPIDAGEHRLDTYCLNQFAQLASRSQVRRLFKRGALRVRDLEAGCTWWIRPGWVIELELPDCLPGPSYTTQLNVIYLDDHLAIVDKPAGLVVGGNRYRTMSRALPTTLPLSPAIDALGVPVPVHRLDARTQGLMVVARSARAQVALGRAFHDRTVHKHYQALVIGKLAGEGQVDLPVEGRQAHTDYRAIEIVRSITVGWITRVSVWPKTGRKHQIRRHLSSLGHAVLGDERYPSHEQILKGQGLFLAAVGLKLPHPITGETLVVTRLPPPKFASFMSREQRRWRKYHPEDSD